MKIYKFTIIRYLKYQPEKGAYHRALLDCEDPAEITGSFSYIKRFIKEENLLYAIQRTFRKMDTQYKEYVELEDREFHLTLEEVEEFKEYSKVYSIRNNEVKVKLTKGYTKFNFSIEVEYAKTGTIQKISENLSWLRGNEIALSRHNWFIDKYVDFLKEAGIIEEELEYANTKDIRVFTVNHKICEDFKFELQPKHLGIKFYNEMVEAQRELEEKLC